MIESTGNSKFADQEPVSVSPDSCEKSATNPIASAFAGVAYPSAYVILTVSMLAFAYAAVCKRRSRIAWWTASFGSNSTLHLIEPKSGCPGLLGIDRRDR